MNLAMIRDADACREAMPWQNRDEESDPPFVMKVIQPVDDLLQHGFRYAFSLTHDHAAAEDLVQEACLAILDANAPLERAYLFTTIRNRFIDEYRRKKRFQHLSLDQEHDYGGPLAELLTAEELDWDAPDILENGALERALSRLRADDREVLYLSAIEGYTAQEIARLTSRPRGTILSAMCRAKRKLRELLEGVAPERGRP